MYVVLTCGSSRGRRTKERQEIKKTRKGVFTFVASTQRGAGQVTYADGSIKPYQLDRSFIRLLSKYGEIAASRIGWNWPGSGVWKWLKLA